jgi:predicted phosphoribosyltransferase
MIFQDRIEAGRLLSSRLGGFDQREDVLVLALPRGGVPVGFEVAQAIHAPLDVFVVRKLGVPGYEELAMGALASGGVQLLSEETIRALGISPDRVDAVIESEKSELERREQLYRGDRQASDAAGHTVIVVDDGMATGLTMRAAVIALRQRGARQIIAAAPTASESACREVEAVADDLVCLDVPPQFIAVGQWYRDFSQTSDEEVRELLARAAKRVESGSPERKRMV